MMNSANLNSASLLLNLQAAGLDISAHLATLYMLARQCATPIFPVVELGVRDGYSTLALLAACRECNAKLVSYDIDASCPTRVANTLDRYCESHASRIAWESAMKDSWCFKATDSLAAAWEWPDEPEYKPLGMLFVDTLHTYDQVRNELEHWLPRLRAGTILCGHDYETPDDNCGVRRAVDEFAACHRVRFPRQVVLPHDWGLWVLLPS